MAGCWIGKGLYFDGLSVLRWHLYLALSIIICTLFAFIVPISSCLWLQDTRYHCPSRNSKEKDLGELDIYRDKGKEKDKSRVADACSLRLWHMYRAGGRDGSCTHIPNANDFGRFFDKAKIFCDVYPLLLIYSIITHEINLSFLLGGEKRSCSDGDLSGEKKTNRKRVRLYLRTGL